MAKTKKYESLAEGEITITVQGGDDVRFVPGETRTFETDNPNVQAALDANPDVKQVKK